MQVTEVEEGGVEVFVDYGVDEEVTVGDAGVGDLDIAGVVAADGEGGTSYVDCWRKSVRGDGRRRRSGGEVLRSFFSTRRVPKIFGIVILGTYNGGGLKNGGAGDDDPPLKIGASSLFHHLLRTTSGAVSGLRTPTGAGCALPPALSHGSHSTSNFSPVH